MARDVDAKRLVPGAQWARDGDRLLPESRTPMLDRLMGWTVDWSRTGGELPAREIFNQLFFELSSLAAEYNVHGILEWDAAIGYVHPAIVFGSDNSLYVSVQNSTNIDPVSDSDQSHWGRLSASGWLPNVALVSSGGGLYAQLVSYVGGSGTAPTVGVGQYLGSTGFVASTANAHNLKGSAGSAGTIGNDGNDGWTPDIALKSDGLRRVFQVVDWTGGSGTKPTINQYIGATGLTTTLADAVDLRGARGLQGQQGSGLPIGSFQILGYRTRRTSGGSWSSSGSTGGSVSGYTYVGRLEAWASGAGYLRFVGHNRTQLYIYRVN